MATTNYLDRMNKEAADKLIALLALDAWSFDPIDYTKVHGTDIGTPLDVLNVPTYSQAVEDDFIRVLKEIVQVSHSSAIAAKLGMAETHVTLIQYALCDADWCDYGTSPMHCFINHPLAELINQVIKRWEKMEHWKD